MPRFGATLPYKTSCTFPTTALQCKLLTVCFFSVFLWEVTVRVVLVITRARSKRILSAYPPHLPPRQPSVSLRESLLETALHTHWSWCILTLMVHTTDLWAVECTQTTLAACVYVPSLMRTYLQPAYSRSKCQYAAAATGDVMTASCLTHTG